MRDEELPAYPLGDGKVILNRRGAHMCYSALIAAQKSLGNRHGGAAPSDAVLWLAEVLRVASRDPAALEPESGRPVKVNTADRAEVGSAVADGGSAAAGSSVEGEPGWLDTRAAAQVIGVSERAVRKACMRGSLRASRVSGFWLIDETDVIAYRDRREGGSHERRAAGPASSTG